MRTRLFLLAAIAALLATPSPVNAQTKAAPAKSAPPDTATTTVQVTTTAPAAAPTPEDVSVK